MSINESYFVEIIISFQTHTNFVSDTMKSFTYAVISAYATAVQVTERWCTWEPEGGDVTKEWEFAWQKWNEPCPEGSRQIGEYTNEMSELEWLKTGQPIEQALREAEREMEDIKADEKAGEDVLNYFLENMKVDGAPLRNVVGGPDQWVLKK